MKKKLLCALMCVAMVSTMLVGCGKKDENKSTTAPTTTPSEGSTTEGDPGENPDATGGKVFYLNFKPEVDKQWKDLAKKYSEETGTEVKVVTAASGQYEQTLRTEIVKADAPTAFHINGPVGYQNWKDYCDDMKNTKLYEWLTNKSYSVTEGDGVYGVAFVVESYGIICNKKIFADYFALEGRANTQAKSFDDINNFAKLKEVVEDMQAKKGDLGIDGVFAPTSMAGGNQWRWQTHLANLPIYFEYQDKDVSTLDTIDFKFGDNYKNIFDLYIENSTVSKNMLGEWSVDDAMAVFALAKCAMVQNGNWGWGQIRDNKDGSNVAAEDIAYLPIYTGVDGEEDQGLCTGTENFLSINKEASAADKAATLAFFEWVFTSEAGKKFLNDEGFIVPFDHYTDRPDNPLVNDIFRYGDDESKNTIPWSFTTFPSEAFKDSFGSELLKYTQGSASWDDVKKTVTEQWASETEKNKPKE